MVADRGYFDGADILACEEGRITVTLPETDDLGAKWRGGIRQAGLCCVAEENVYICPAGERLARHFTNEEHGLVFHRYWTNTCQSCSLKPKLHHPAKSDGSKRVGEHRAGSRGRMRRGSTSIRKK